MNEVATGVPTANPKRVQPLRLAASFAEVLLGFVYPPWCQICSNHRATPSDGFVCAPCAKTVRWVMPPFCFRCGLPFQGSVTRAFECTNCMDRTWAFETARAAVIAEGITLDVIHRYKYQEAIWFEPFLANLLIQAAVPTLLPGEWQLLVPVPLHPVRHRERGFNQAERLARRLSKASGIPVAPPLLERVEFTPTQTRLSREQRAKNVNEAFQPKRNARLRGESCVIIDDVLTTGATTNAVAHALKKLGAGNLIVWSTARAAFKPELIGAHSQ
jgi:ComF family protein